MIKFEEMIFTPGILMKLEDPGNSDGFNPDQFISLLNSDTRERKKLKDSLCPLYENENLSLGHS
jgi:hypothetical protein